MKKYLMNKNVNHNGKDYLKGSEIKEGDDGFKSIVDSGHTDSFDFSAKVEKASEVEPEVEEQPTFNKKGKK